MKKTLPKNVTRILDMKPCIVKEKINIKTKVPKEKTIALTEGVTVYLKITEQGVYNPRILECLSQWIKGCEDNNYSYVILTGEYQGLLPDNNAEEIISNVFFSKEPLGLKLTNLVNSSICDHTWRPVAQVHLLPYFHNKRKITINIDADDVYHSLTPEVLLPKMVKEFKLRNLNTLSYDVYFSVSIRLESRPHHWSFGVNVSKTKKMRQILTKALSQKEIPSIGFCNIDYLVDYYLEHNTEGPIAAITTEGAYDHCGRIEYLPEEDCVQLTYGRDRTIRPRHPRTILI